MFLFWIWIFYLLLFSQNSNFCIRKFVLKNFAKSIPYKKYRKRVQRNRGKIKIMLKLFLKELIILNIQFHFYKII